MQAHFFDAFASSAPPISTDISQNLIWSNGDSSITFGPNQPITISTGKIQFLRSCDVFYQDDNIYPFADVYIVKHGNVTSFGQKLVDAGGDAPNTIMAPAHGGLFVNELIGFTGPSGKIGPGTYDVIYDECQDGVFGPEDELFKNAFNVFFPADVPNIPSSDMLALKNNAKANLDYYKKVLFSTGLFYIIITTFSQFGSFEEMFQNFLTFLFEAVGPSDPMLAMEIILLNTVRHYKGIVDDPPDTNFKGLTLLNGTKVIDPLSDDPVLTSLAKLGTVVGSEDSLIQALLSSIERYEGAADAKDGEWALIHANEMKNYAQLLSAQLGKTNSAISQLKNNITNISQFDSSVANMRSALGRIEASGFSANELRILQNLGFNNSQINEMKVKLLSQNLSSFNKDSYLDLLSGIESNNYEFANDLQTFSNDISGIISSLKSNPYVIEDLPFAHAGGPYMGVDGTPVTFNGTLSSAPVNSSIASYQWDLNGDGKFDDAYGPMVSFTYNKPFEGYVGLLVNNTNGLSSVSYSPIEIVSHNVRPQIDSYFPQSPNSTITVNTSSIFRASSSDADGDPVYQKWYLDGKLVSTGDSLTYTPTSSDLGVHIIRVNATDNAIFGGAVTVSWLVYVVMPDKDGDGWNANIDCNDNNPNVNPAVKEIFGNGIDDDCNPATGDANHPPVAFNQTGANTFQNTPTRIILTGNDVDLQPLTFSISSNPTSGTLSNFTQLNSTAASVVYTPTKLFSGQDSFKFKVNDGLANSTNDGVVSINVTPNHPPVAVDKAGSLPEDHLVRMILTATDLDLPTQQQNLTFSIYANPTSGTLSNFTQLNNTAASVVYTPNHDYNGQDSFRFKVNDGLANSVKDGVVSITVTPVNDPPIVRSSFDKQINKNVKDSIPLFGSDVDGNFPLTFYIVRPPAHGVLDRMISTSSFVTYTPNPSYFGNDSFTFVANDGFVNSTNTGTINISVINHVPFANNGGIGTYVNLPVNITLQGIDGDNDPLTYSITKNPSHGTLSNFNATKGSLLYTPDHGYCFCGNNGTDSFTFKVNDGIVDSNNGTEQIFVNNHNPVMVNRNHQLALTTENTPVKITVKAIDPDNEPLSFFAVTRFVTSFGTITGVSNTTDSAGLSSILEHNTTSANFTYTPNPGYTGQDSIRVYVKDPHGGTHESLIGVSINKANNPGPFTKDDLFVSVYNSQIERRSASGNGTLKQILVTSSQEAGVAPTGMGFDSQGNLYATEFNGGLDLPFDPQTGGPGFGMVSKFDKTGKLLGEFGNGYNWHPESIAVDKAGNIYVGQADAVTCSTNHDTLCGAFNGKYDLLKFDQNGTMIRGYFMPNEARGADWIDLAPDQCTMYYTSEFIHVKRFNVCTDTPLADFATLKSNQPAYALRLLPNGNVLVADNTDIDLLDGNGKIIKTYAVPTTITGWFAINLDPDGKSFWTGNIYTNDVYKFDIATGKVLESFRIPYGAMAGLAMAGEITSISANQTAPFVFNQHLITKVNKPINITISGFDADKNDTLAFSMVNGPGNGTLSSITPVNRTAARVMYTPNANFSGSDVFKFKANDGTFDSTTNGTISILVNNLPPIADAGPDQHPINNVTTITLNGANSHDQESNGGTIASYLWKQIAGPTVVLNSTNTSAVQFKVPFVTSNTKLTFQLSATDSDDNLTGTDTVDVFIPLPNKPPVVGITSDPSSSYLIVGGKTIKLIGSIKDPDDLSGHVLADPDGNTYSSTIKSWHWNQTAGPAVNLTKANTLRPSFIAPAVQTNTNFRFNLTATDVDGATSTFGLDLMVLPNQPPTVDVGPDRTVPGGSIVSLSPYVYDPDGRVSIAYWNQTAGPNVQVNLVDAFFGTYNFKAPRVSVDTPITLKFTAVDDSGSSSSDSLNILIKPNKLPVVKASVSPSSTVRQGTAVTLKSDGSFDPDGRIVSYLWNQTAGPVKLTLAPDFIGSNNRKFTAPLTVTNDTEFTFNLTAIDDSNESSSATVNVIVTPNMPPIASAGADQIVNENTTNVILNGTASTDKDGAIKSYMWNQTAGPTVSLIGTNTSKATFTAPSVTANTTLTFKLTTRDNDNATSTATTNVLVKNVNIPPVAVTAPGRPVNENTTGVKLDGSGSYDRDGNIVSYVWTQLAGPNVTLSAPNTAIPTFTAPSVSSNTNLVFKLVVTDNDGANSSNPRFVAIKVVNVNIPPVANAGADQTVNIGNTVTLDGSSSYDRDGNITSYIWQQISGPAVSLVNGNTSHPTFTAPQQIASDTTLTFRLTVTDNDGASSSATTNVLLKNANIPPVADAGTNQIVNENATNVVLDGTKSYDKDGTIVSYIWQQLSGTNITLADSNTSKATFTAPSVTKDSNLQFKLTVTDNVNANSSAITNVLVKNVNIPPVANAGSNQTVNENTTNVVLDGGASYDKDGNIVSYSWKQIPSSSSSSSPITVNLNSTNTKAVSFTAPSVTKDTPLAFNLTVADNDGASSSAIVGVMVKNVNIPPVANAGANQTVNENTANVKLDGTGSYDKDGTIASYQWQQLSGTPVTLTGANTATPTFTAPPVNANTTLTFALTVTDNDGARSNNTIGATTNVIVKNVNIAPTAIITPANQTVNASQTVVMDGSQSNDNKDGGNIAAYQWQQISGTPVTLTGANTAKASFTAPSANTDSTLTFRLTVTDDDGGASNSTTSNVIVKRFNQPPIANAGSNQTVNGGSTVTLDGSKSTDPDGGSIASYSWTQTAGPSVTLQGSSTAKPTFTAPSNLQQDTTFTFSLKVTDTDGGATSTNAATVNVLVKKQVIAVNQPPVAKAAVSSSTGNIIGYGSIVTLDGTGSYDPDGGSIVSYTWQQTAGPAVTLSGSNTAKSSFTAPQLAADTTLTFALTVKDSDGGATATTSVNVVVAAHPGTIGYWKNHQQQTVSLLPQMLGSLYKVDSWTKASSVFNTASASNAYDGLAAQLLSTKLDIKNGSPTCSSITNAVSQADTALTNAAYKGPGTTKAPSGSTKTTVTNVQKTLDTYNNYGCMGLAAASASGSSMSIASTTNASTSPTTTNTSSTSSPQTTTQPNSSPTQKAAMNNLSPSASITTTTTPSPSSSSIPVTSSSMMKTPTTTTTAQNITTTTPGIATNTSSTTKPSSSSPISRSSTTPQRQQLAQLPPLQGQPQQQLLQPQLPMMNPNQVLSPSLYPYQLQGQQQQQLQQLLPPPIAVAGMSQVVDANTNVMLDGRNSYIPILQQPMQQQQQQGRMIIAYQWTQIPVGVSVNLTNANTPTPSFTAPALPYDTTLEFSLRVLSNDGMVSSNPAMVYVMVKHYSGSSGIPQQQIPQQPLLPQQQQAISPPLPQQQPQPLLPPQQQQAISPPLPQQQPQQSLPPLQQQIVPPQQQQPPVSPILPQQQGQSVPAYPYPYSSSPVTTVP